MSESLAGTQERLSEQPAALPKQSPKRQRSIADEEAVSTGATLSAQPLDSMQREFLETLNSLLLAVHEVVYTANLLEDSVVDSHPELRDHVTAVKHLGKIAWRFQKLAKRVAAAGAAP